MDIDLDTPTNFKPLEIFPEWTKASMVRDGLLKPHPCGVHPVTIPADPMSGVSAIPYKDAEALDFFKLDFLHLNVYNYFESREQIEELLKIDPPWELLRSPSVCKQLFQNLGKHFDIVQDVSPKSIQEMGDVLALIRPAKRFLLKTYLDKGSREYARKKLYERSENDEGYQFKKSHAIAYALVIVLQLHLISAGINFE